MKLFRTTLLYLWAMAAFGCGKSEYRITEPRPTLEVTALQDVYIINQPAYLQLKVSQQGYDGEFQLSAVLSEGACELSMQGSDLPTDGTWASMSNTTEILTLTPTLAGPLRISFEVKTKEGEQSGRSFINFNVQKSSRTRTGSRIPRNGIRHRADRARRCSSQNPDGQGRSP